MDIAGFFSESGPLAACLDTYEYRAQQQEMAETVARVFSGGGIAVIEAGTGTGKSIAYLAPALTWAKANGKKVVVSTNTINLQEQLINKDIPLLSRALAFEFKTALVKGWSNYLCLYRLHKAAAEESRFAGQAKLMAQLTAFATGSPSGSKSDLQFPVPPEIWELVACESDACLRHKCPAFSDCFYFAERKKAMTADLLVVNHHLLFADLAIRNAVGYEQNAVLPAYSHVIIDEAHHIEETATSHFSLSLSYPGLEQVIGRLYHRQGHVERGALAAVKKTACALDSPLPSSLREEIDGLLEWRVLPGLRQLDDAGQSFFRLLKAFLAHLRPPGHETMIRLNPGSFKAQEQGEFADVNEVFGRALVGTAQAVRDLKDAFETAGEFDLDDHTGTMVALEAALRRLFSYEESRRFLTEMTNDRYVFWGEIEPSPRIESRLSASPVVLGPHLRETLFEQMDTVVLTSATLSTGGDFGFFRQRVGLDRDLETLAVEEKAIESPFNYEDQVALAVPKDLPDPNSPVYPVELAGALREWVLASRGRAFVLFTSYSMLMKVYRELSRSLPDDYVLLRQGDCPRNRLLETFRSTVNSVLMGTDSFWEGVDVPGSSLSLVVITRLPFQVPTDPVLMARLERLESEGYNSFYNYQLPQAVIKLKQGFGRLIRHREDRGVVVICDNRVTTRGYGRAFLNSLPHCRFCHATSEEITRVIALRAIE